MLQVITKSGSTVMRSKPYHTPVKWSDYLVSVLPYVILLLVLFESGSMVMRSYPSIYTCKMALIFWVCIAMCKSCCWYLPSLAVRS